MDDISRIAIEDAVGVLTIDSPPVNALGTAVRRALVSGITQLTQDDTVSAIVIQCAGRTFFAGADISEFGKPPQSPNLPEVLEHIENCPKPVIAAIHGTALGGGYELALNCHYRIAVPSAKVGLPEVKLGLLPGAGGTQRLPRLVGPKIALELIVNGDPVPAPKALELGMIDALADEGQLHRMAVEYARSVVAQNLPLYRVRDRGDKIAPGSFDPKLFDEFRRANASAMRGFKAPEHIIRAIEAAVSLPFDDGIARERALFGELRESPESDAQRYYFFAKRKADKSFANSDASEDIVADRMRKALADQAEAAISGGTSPRQIDDVLYDYGFPPDYLQTIGVNPGNAPASGATAKADESLLTSLLFSVAKEGARMLEQGIVPHASDIDVAAIHCCHWPVYKGGPMFWADRAGAPKKAAEPDRARAQFDQSEGELMADAYIIDAVRTPRGIGKVGKGALAHLHPQHLAATVLAALAERNALNTGEIDDIIWSTSMQRGKQGGDLGRMAALDAGYDIKASGTTLDRFCGGGITSVSLAAAQIMSGMEDLLIAGGTEMMSLTATMMQEDIAAGLTPMRMGAHNARLAAKYPQPQQGVCADAIASLEGIGREALDALGLESQKRAAAAIAEGRFDRSIVPVIDDTGQVVLAKDEYPRPDTTAEGLAALKPAFAQIADMSPDKDGPSFGDMIRRKHPGLTIEPVHHAGSSSGVVDGAAGLLLASRQYAAEHGLTPRARVVATANVGDDPTLMLNAPVPAIRKVLAKAGLGIEDIDLWEINEAFAVVVEKCVRDLQLDRSKVNVNGGSIALGHPIGATGSILIGTALDELERTGGRYALITMCAAGGMAPAIIIERV